MAIATIKTLILSLALLFASLSSAQVAEAPDQRMLIIGHRGSPGIGQENTIAGFKRAIELGADGFELDLVLTADNKLVVFHDWTLNRLIGNAQLEQRFPTRSSVQDGKRVWETRAFTLKELQTLNVNQAGLCSDNDPDSSPAGICSYEDALLAFQELRRTYPDIVLYTELKTSSEHMTHDEIVLMANLTAQALIDAGESSHPQSHWLQSFDSVVMDVLVGNDKLDGMNKCQLLSCEPGLIASANPVTLDVTKIMTESDLRHFLESNVASRGMTMVHGWKLMWWHLLTEKEIDCAKITHELGLKMHAFTFRDHKFAADYIDRPVLAPNGPVFSTPESEIDFFRKIGFDAVMTDCITSAIAD